MYRNKHSQFLRRLAQRPQIALTAWISRCGARSATTKHIARYTAPIPLHTHNTASSYLIRFIRLIDDPPSSFMIIAMTPTPVRILIYIPVHHMGSIKTVCGKDLVDELSIVSKRLLLECTYALPALCISSGLPCFLHRRS